MRQAIARHMTAERLLEIARFGLVGVGATLVHMSVALGLERLADLPLALINLIGFCTAFILSFCGHYYWTFRSNGPRHQAFLRFFIVALIGFGASTVMLATLQAIGFAGDTAKLMISILVIPPVTFVVGKLWAFAP